MFDIGMGEIGLLGVVALLVLGPERLPGAARTAGALLRKARQSWQSVRSEVERELAAEELRNTIQRNTDAMKSDAGNINAALRDVVHAASTPDPKPTPAHDPTSTTPDERR
ncbi:MAG TPA: Sec-independent protein translocase protein TatB [Rudaea sp.]|nr:Sec-independent protein translocase protein TatB [Rudaea sp.]